MASSKNNENTNPISGGSVGWGAILHNEIIVQKKIINSFTNNFFWTIMLLHYVIPNTNII